MISSLVRSLITTGDVPPKYVQTIRTGSIEEFLYIEQIYTWNLNLSMEPVRIVCPYFDGTSHVVIYDLTYSLFVSSTLTQSSTTEFSEFRLQRFEATPYVQYETTQTRHL